ncbi:MAG: PIN domain-containing protein [Nitrospinae bacterium]|nr:PIN domain-containing protein [Nitrospinota bacterium]
MNGKVLIDTSVWIEFFRKKDSPVSRMLREFLKMDQACYAGPIAVELYQGAKTQQEILVLEQLFQTISYVEITREHYHHAGLISQRAARKGKTFSTVDVVLATVAQKEGLSLFSLDSHFKDIAKYCDVHLINL